MAYLLGQMLGAFVILLLISRVILLAFRTKKYTHSAVVVSTFIALVVTTLLAGVGMSDDSGPQFASAFINYVIPAIFVVVIDLVRLSRRNSKLNSRVPPSSTID